MEEIGDFEGCITHGPWGGSEGHKWVYMPLPPGFIKKTKIVVRYCGVVVSINFETNNRKGEAQSSFFGGTDGFLCYETDTICIDYPNEYLMSISGTYVSHVVTSIRFMTNLKLYGPYGTDNGTIFSSDVKDGFIAGFHGRVNKYLTAIGVYTIPKSLPSGPNPTYEGKIMNELSSSMSRMSIMPRDAGPWGGCGGKPWDDGVFSAVKQVRVHLGELNVIYALQFEYLKSDGESVFSQIHGEENEFKIKVILNLDAMGEYLTGISGFYGTVKEYDGQEAIVSISFHTNKRTHGPYGDETCAGRVYFSSAASFGKVVGFHGRTNGLLTAIGVHMEYF